LLERRLDPSDRRIRRLHLLPAAKPILMAIQRYKDDLHADLTEGLDDATVKNVTEALLHMKARLTSEPAVKIAAAGE
jgi:DNA-binding MarR family transcriptional regulator